jgi:glycosyltransferase involved in cell wall biosynthesis
VSRPSTRFLIVFPAKDEARNLYDLVANLVAQDLTDWLLFVGDNCSLDSTTTVLADIAAREPRVVFRSFSNGVSVCENWLRTAEAALDQVDSRYVTFLSGDDRLQATTYLSSMAAAIDAGLDFAAPVFIHAVDDSPPIMIAPEGRSPWVRRLRLCTDWKVVHLVHSSFTRDAFQYLLNRSWSRPSPGVTCDWPLAYAVLDLKGRLLRDVVYIRGRRGQAYDSDYYSEPSVPASPPAATSSTGQRRRGYQDPVRMLFSSPVPALWRRSRTTMNSAQRVELLSVIVLLSVRLAWSRAWAVSQGAGRRFRRIGNARRDK